jgi:hypothetical protein
MASRKDGRVYCDCGLGTEGGGGGGLYHKMAEGQKLSSWSVRPRTHHIAHVRALYISTDACDSFGQLPGIHDAHRFEAHVAVEFDDDEGTEENGCNMAPSTIRGYFHLYTPPATVQITNMSCPSFDDYLQVPPLCSFPRAAQPSHASRVYRR